VTAFVGAALLLAGCGSSSETTKSTSTPALTVPERATFARLPQAAAPGPSTQPPTSGHGIGGEAFLIEVFHDAQGLWRREFEAAGKPYTPARKVIFRDQVQTACGTQSAQVGPFYCPADHGVYLDIRFFDALSHHAGVRFGDLAQAYVVAHEMGHHVQTLLGITQAVRAADAHDPAGKNLRSVRLELQADCLAGVWIHSRYHRGQVTPADFENALAAAAAVGDDFGVASGSVSPENWSHGTSAQRQHWLTRGFQQGRPGACDTFG
jgi:predicted metalloprotease